MKLIPAQVLDQFQLSYSNRIKYYTLIENRTYWHWDRIYLLLLDKLEIKKFSQKMYSFVTVLYAVLVDYSFMFNSQFKSVFS